MAIGTKAELVATLLRWTRRPDLAAEAPDWIALAEAQMQRRLRVSAMIGRATATISDGYSAVPSDFAGLISIDLNTDPPTKLDFSGAQEMVRRGTVYFAAGKPTGFSIVGNQFQFSPTPDGDYTARLTYWKRIPALTDASPTNWLLASHPDAYLYGALLHSGVYRRGEERLETFMQLFTAALADIEADDARRSYGAAVATKPRSLG